MAARLEIDPKTIGEFCRKWQISEMALFGSALRDDFGPDSDVDILVAFKPEAEWSLFDHVRMEDELARILGRKVDLITRRSIERSANWIRRNEILGTAEPIYVSG